MKDKVISQQSMSLYADQLGRGDGVGGESPKKRRPPARASSIALPTASTPLATQRPRGSSPLSRRSNSSLTARIDARIDGRQYTVEEKRPHSSIDSETVISVWINDEHFSLKMYDIMSMQKGDGLPKISNETFTIAPDTVSIRCLFNPK